MSVTLVRDSGDECGCVEVGGANLPITQSTGLTSVELYLGLDQSKNSDQVSSMMRSWTSALCMRIMDNKKEILLSKVDESIIKFLTKKASDRQLKIKIIKNKAISMMRG